MTSVAVLGTGLLGTAIATRLLEQGLNVNVWNRDPSRVSPLVERGAKALEDPQHAAENLQTIITVLRDGETTASVIGAVGTLHGSTLIPMGTMGVGESRKLAIQVAEQGGRYLEAPVLGSRPQALSGTLLVMAGGEAHDFKQQHTLLTHLAEQPLHVGPVGSGAATKLALNQMIASLTHSFSLSLRLIQQSGVPVETFMSILRSSALYAPTFDKKIQRMLDQHYSDPNFSTALLRKDLRLFLEEAAAAELQTTGIDGLATLLEKAQEGDLDGQDYCALHELTTLR